MRKKDRIEPFMMELAKIWEENVPDWRFGQLMLNVLSDMNAEGRDPFFPEEKEMLEYFRGYFSKKKGDKND